MQGAASSWSGVSELAGGAGGGATVAQRARGAERAVAGRPWRGRRGGGCGSARGRGEGGGRRAVLASLCAPGASPGAALGAADPVPRPRAPRGWTWTTGWQCVGGGLHGSHPVPSRGNLRDAKGTR